MSRAPMVSASLIHLFLVAAAGAANVILYDFETDAEGWATEWGAKSEPVQSTKFARHGTGSLLFEHEFGKKNETAGVRIQFPAPRDFATDSGFAGFSAWIFIPIGDEWEAQMYIHNGENWDWSEGQLYKKLEPGWHQLFIRPEQIQDAGKIRDIGIQVKNFKLAGKASVFIDQVEALSTSKE
jgi:hypothetical protein